MDKLVIAIEMLEDEAAFDAAWPTFLRLAEQMPGLRREATSRVHAAIFGRYPYVMIHELYFDSQEALSQALSSAVGREAGAFLQKMTGGRVALALADHNEDSGENLSRLRGGGDA